MKAGGFIDRLGAALITPRRALEAADRPEAAGRAPGDLALLILAVFAATYLGSVVRSAWLIGAGEIGGGLTVLATRLGATLRTPLIALLAGVVVVTAAAGRKRRFGADSDLACLAFVPAVVVALAGALITSIAGPVAHLETATDAVGLLWYAGLLALAVVQARFYRGADDGDGDSAPEVWRGSPRGRIAGFATLAALVALTAIGTIRVTSEIDRYRPTVSGDPAPAFALPRIEDGGRLGAQVSLDGLEGKVVLIDFWATWCRPCRTSMPLLDEVVRDRADVVLLSVHIEGPDKRSRARDMVDRLAPSALLVADTRGVNDDYGVEAIPHLVLVDPAGVVRHVHRGGVVRSVQAELRERIDELLR